MDFQALARLHRFRAHFSETRPVAPRSSMQIHTQDMFWSKPRIFLTDPGSLELSYRAKGTEEVCGGGAFSCECGATPYGLKLRDNCL